MVVSHLMWVLRAKLQSSGKDADEQIRLENSVYVFCLQKTCPVIKDRHHLGVEGQKKRYSEHEKLGNKQLPLFKYLAQ